MLESRYSAVISCITSARDHKKNVTTIIYASIDAIHTDLGPISPLQDNPRGLPENAHNVSM